MPGFTFGLDLVIVIGQLRLAQQHSLDQAHQAIQARLARFGLTMSRRETLYLFEASWTLVRAAQDCAADTAWQEQGRTNGGLIISIDGLQPDKGTETVSLVRDVLTGRLLAAENGRMSDTATLQRLLAPVVALALPVLGAISDAQESLGQAIAALWPDLPHQLCQVHDRREASRPMYDLDRHVRKEMRTAIQPPVRAGRDQVERQAPATAADHPAEAAQLAVLGDDALAIQTALNLDGHQPFRDAGLAVDDAVADVASSLERLEQGGPGTAAGVLPSSSG